MLETMDYAISNMSRTIRQWLLLALCSYIHVAVYANNGYLVTHPLMFRPNLEERISVTIFEPSNDMKVQARLLWKDEVVAETEKFIFGKDFLTLQVPGHIYGRAKVEVCGNCELGATGFHFKNSTTVDVADKSSSVFIQIDKPVYKPGQEVHINFIVTGPDLRPREEKMEAYIKDPQGSRMIHWKNLKSVCCGIMNITFPLSDQPVLGEWTIVAEVQTQLYNQTFEVKKYVLPKFEVLIQPVSYIEDIHTCETATVTARYIYGKPVEGKLSINMNLHGLGHYDNYIGQNNYMFMDIHGTASFDICVSDLLSSLLKPRFRGVVRIEASVTSNDGNAFTAVDESCLVHKQLISLKFSDDTREHYKPGLPYFGKAELSYPDGSPADDITVRVRAENNNQIAYSQEDYISSGGVVEFSIPTLPVGSGMVWLDTRILAIEGVDVSDTYFSTYKYLGSWYSPSHCHILLRNLEPNLKVGDSAIIGVLSTCPCNFTYHYEVMGRGNILTSGSHRAIHSYNRNKRSQDPVAEVLIWDDVMHKNSTIPAPPDHCETIFSFVVTHDMVPLSRVLVYYVLENEEGVADSLSFTVEPSFENQVKVRLTRNETRPGHKLSMAIAAKPGSCVCIAAVDKSVHLLKPGYQLTPHKIFQEMAEYDISAAIREDTFWWQTGFKRKRRSSQWRAMRSRDPQYAFGEAGLKVMTDRVRLVFPVQDNTRNPTMGKVKPDTNDTDYRLDRRRRAYFPETWIWQCFNLSDTRKEEHVRVHAPDSITTWRADILAFSKTYGLGVAQPVSLTAFKDFFVEMTLPYSVIRGEQLRVPVTVYNYMDFCVQLSLTMHLQAGVRFLGETSRSYAKKLCLEAGQVLTTHVVLVFSELGKRKIHAGAEAHYSPNCCEGPVSEEKVVAVDKIAQNILVEAEGIPRGYAYSVFFCPDERIHISTPNKYEYQFVKKPAAMEFLTFLCKAKNDATIGLATNHDTHELYEIVLGGQDNSISWIARSRMGDQLVMEVTPDILSWDEFRPFWITWDNAEIKVGHGEVPTNDSVILTWYDDDPLGPIEYVGFSTGMGSIGEFRIWRKKDDDKALGNEAYSEAFMLTLPLNFVPGSERAAATIIGDVMGPTLNNLHNLIRLPFGCGEQNMIHFAPIVYVIGYLKRTNQLTVETETEAKTFLVQGYQRQLTYKRHDGSYSAFGETDSSGSMWLTAFVLKSFAQSRAFIYIDPKELEESKGWIVDQQEVDGSFPPIGRVMNKDIQGGIQGKISLTAYVLVALLEAGLDTAEEQRAVTIAQQFLEDNIESVVDPYTAALVAYALTVQSSSFAQDSVRILSNMAIKKEGLTYWRLSGQPLDTLPFYMMDTSIEQSVSSAEVEMTAYALLTFTAMGDIAYSLPIVKWLTQQRNSLGGFSSTQDTCVALQALSEYATLAYVGHVNLNISLAYSDMTSLVEEHCHLNNENSQVLQVIEIPVLSKTLFLGASGEGCGLMQIDVNYNIPDPNNKPSFKLNVNLIEDDFLAGIFPPGRKRRNVGSGGDISNETPNMNEYKVVIETCTRWLHAGSSNMAVVEVSLLSGFTAGVESLERLLLDKHSKVKRYELSGRKVILYFDEIPSQCMTCIRFDAYREYAVGKLSPVPVKVYDYYEPHFEATKFYNVSRESPLSGELCEEDRVCNQVEDQDIAPPQPALQPDAVLEDLVPPIPEQCNSLDGDCITPADMVHCMCERTCLYGGSWVCGSDGAIYENYCMLEVAACQMNTNIRAMPMHDCPGPEVTTMEVPVEDGSGVLRSKNSTESMLRTSTLATTESTHEIEATNFPKIVGSKSEEPKIELPGGAAVQPQPRTLPSGVGAKGGGNMDITNTDETQAVNEEIEIPGEQVAGTSHAERVANVDSEQEDTNLQTPHPPDLAQEFQERQDIIQVDNTKVTVDASISNVNTSPQTVVDHEQQPEQVGIRDSSRTEMREDRAQAGTIGTLAQDKIEEETDLLDQNEKVTSAYANAWPDEMHDRNEHENFANEVVNEESEAEAPTEIIDHTTSHIQSPATDAVEDMMETEVLQTESINEIIRHEPANLTHDGSKSHASVPDDEIRPSERTHNEDLSNTGSTGTLPIQPTGHQQLHNLDYDHMDSSVNQTQERSKDKDQNFTHDQEEHNQTYLQDSNQKEQYQKPEGSPTEQAVIPQQEKNEQIKQIQVKEIKVVPSEKTSNREQDQIYATESLDKTSTQKIPDQNNSHVFEQEEEVDLSEEIPQTTPSTTEGFRGDGEYLVRNAENVAESSQHAGEHTVNQTNRVKNMKTLLQTTKPSKTEAVPTNASDTIEPSNQSNTDIEPTNTMREWKTNETVSSGWNHSNTKPPERPSEHDNVSSASPTVEVKKPVKELKTTSLPSKETQPTKNGELHIGKKERVEFGYDEETLDHFNSPFANLDTLVNDQGIPETSVEDDIKEDNLAKHGSTRER